MISVTADLQSVVEELYGAPPADFMRLRTEAAKLARTSGDKELAEAIGKLRKPSRSAWVLNQLVRTQPEAVDQLLSLGEQLREAEKNLQGTELRRLSLQRGEAVEALVHSALQAAGITAPDADLRREIEETLTAALAEPTVADSLRTGALVKPAAWSGFGVAPPEDLAAVPPRPRQGRGKKSVLACPHRSVEIGPDRPRSKRPSSGWRRQKRRLPRRSRKWWPRNGK
jgi:hypothetical protein